MRAMENGPWHYAEAERLLTDAEEQDPEWAQVFITRAQVHAMLAQVQATIDAAPSAHSLTEWGKRNADSKPPVIEEAEPEPVKHAARMDRRSVPVPGTTSTREVYAVWCLCGYTALGTFTDKEVALQTLVWQHPEAAKK